MLKLKGKKMLCENVINVSNFSPQTPLLLMELKMPVVTPICIKRVKHVTVKK